VPAAYTQPATVRHHRSQSATECQRAGMNSKQPLPIRSLRTTRFAFPWHHFTMRFSSTPRGTRLALGWAYF
jgi:hypothetical protein